MIDEGEGLELGMKTLLLRNSKQLSNSNVPLMITLNCQYLTLILKQQFVKEVLHIALF